MNSNTANVLGQKKVFTKQKGLTPSGLVWTPTSVAAAVSLFWDTNSNNDGNDYENVTKKKKKSPCFKLKREIRYFRVQEPITCSEGEEMYKKARCTCRVVVCLIKPCGV